MFTVSYEDVKVCSVGRVFEEQIFLQRCDVGQKGLAEDLSLVKGDDVLERQDHRIHGSGQIQAAQDEEEREGEQANEYLGLHGFS